MNKKKSDNFLTCDCNVKPLDHIFWECEEYKAHRDILYKKLKHIIEPLIILPIKSFILIKHDNVNTL